MVRAIHWFRRDLRLSDNPSLYYASKCGPILPVYILDESEPEMGAASRVWLYHSLSALNKQMEDRLIFERGSPVEILTQLCLEYGINKVFWNRCYEPYAIERDRHIKTTLGLKGITVQSYNGSLLWEPWEVKKEDCTPYKVFTPFYRKGCLQATYPRDPLPKVASEAFDRTIPKSLPLSAYPLLPKARWGEMILSGWTIGEVGAEQALHLFLQQKLQNYKEGRNIPFKMQVSRLSPHLHFGEISPHQIWHEIHKQPLTADVDTFCSELGWREFSYSLLYHHPTLPHANLQPKFDHFPWAETGQELKDWQQGKTGIPIVDAGMRELWQTGYMHNRVRMIVASFLVKNLRLHWRHGASWFWDTLFDADLANNSASWQWVAGSGADAAPYFRIFNPVTQAEKFDPEGLYIKQYVPELSQLPLPYLFKPWAAPSEILKAAKIELGLTYPKPIVCLEISRKKALEAFALLRKEKPI